MKKKTIWLISLGALLLIEAGYLHTFYFFEHTWWDMVSDFSVGDKVKVTTIHRKNEITYNVFTLGIVKE